MITKEEIQERINKLTVEQAALQSRHDAMVKEHQDRTAQFQQIVAGNQNRFQQITGAIAQLTEMLQGVNGETPPENPPG